MYDAPTSREKIDFGLIEEFAVQINIAISTTYREDWWWNRKSQFSPWNLSRSPLRWRAIFQGRCGSLQLLQIRVSRKNGLIFRLRWIPTMIRGRSAWSRSPILMSLSADIVSSPSQECTIDRATAVARFSPYPRTGSLRRTFHASHLLTCLSHTGCYECDAERGGWWQGDGVAISFHDFGACPRAFTTRVARTAPASSRVNFGLPDNAAPMTNWP